MARVKEQKPRMTDDNDLVTQAKEYAVIKKQMEYLEKQQRILKAKLFEHIELEGEPDDKGNIILELPLEVEGFITVMKQRRVSRKINDEAAIEIIAAKGLEDKLYKTIRVVDEDELMAALYNDELTEEEVDEMYPPSIVWALVLGKK